MKLDAIVLHNVSPDMFFRYRPETSSLHHAHTLTVEADSPEQALDLIWTLTNVDPMDLRLNLPHLAEYVEQMEHYRRRMNRSMCVGDVVVLIEGDRLAGSYACDVIGWSRLDDPVIDLRLRDHFTNGDERSAAYPAHQEYMDSSRR